MMKLWYKLEYAFHMMEAYLAEQRQDTSPPPIANAERMSANAT